MPVKRWGKQMILAMGYELRRASNRQASAPQPMVDDPIAAVHLARGSARVAFECPLEKVRDTQGFSFATHGWHPLVAAIHDRHRMREDQYEGAVLQRYFARFQPRTALDAIPGFRAEEHCGLADLPPHLFHLTPWFSGSATQLDQDVRRWSGGDAAQHGLVDYDLDCHGVSYFGPASQEVGEMEIKRLRSVCRALEAQGFDRGLGDCRFYLVRRDGDFRAIAFGGGRHRAAAMAALGQRFVPAQFEPPIAVDVRDVAEWPQVRSGIWSEIDALNYVDHLFDFDSLAWARKRQLA
ncbi:MAG: hypothetical protein R6U98_11915 [Pirellulaceae bacterium]